MKEKKHRRYFVWTILIVLLLAIVSEFFTIKELHNYERGFLELYALEQDGYVQVTVDQIMRLGNNASEDEITDIIGSIDANSSKYWTLNTGDNILFVKSVTETNRYKNFAPDTYYNTDSAKQFVSTLSTERVKHKIIFIDDERYVASGVLFVWHDVEYRICLLTLDKAVLDRNELMQAKYSLIVVVNAVMAICLLGILGVVRMIDIKNEAIWKATAREHVLNTQLERLDKAYRLQETYSAAQHSFAEDVLDKFLDELDCKNVYPIYWAFYKAKDEAARTDFLHAIQIIIDGSVLRFNIGDEHLLLIFAGYDKREAESYAKKLMGYNVSLIATKFVENNYCTYREQYEKFMKEVWGE